VLGRELVQDDEGVLLGCPSVSDAKVLVRMPGCRAVGRAVRLPFAVAMLVTALPDGIEADDEPADPRLAVPRPGEGIDRRMGVAGRRSAAARGCSAELSGWRTLRRRRRPRSPAAASSTS
jgi:hypothetical protein